MNPPAWAIAETIRRHNFRYASEEQLQDTLASLLADEGYPVQREVRLDRRSRIDLLVGRVGVEVKVAGRAATVERQLRRYAAHPDIDALVLVTGRVRHRPPEWIGDVCVHTVQLAEAGL